MSCLIKRFVGLASFFVLLMIVDQADAGNSIIFKVNSNIYQAGGQLNHMDVAPYIKNGRVYLPLRYVAQAAGISNENIFWNDPEKSVTFIKGNRIVRFVISSRSFTVNGVSFSMDAAPEIVNGRTMLPVRYVAQSMDLVVSWDESSQTVAIDTPLGQGKKSGSRNLQSITYDAGVKTFSKDFKWEYNGIKYGFHVEIPVTLIEWNRKILSLADEFYSTANGYSQMRFLSSLPDNIRKLIISLSDQSNGNIVPWVNEEANYKFAGHLGNSLADQARKDGYDYFHAAELALSFVGGAIPYKEAGLQLPAQTLVDDGDCDCKSVLLAAILKNMGYKVALLKYPTHAAVGIAFDDHQIPKGRELLYYNYNGTKYYYCETTTAGWSIGQASDKIEKTAFVYPVD